MLMDTRSVDGGERASVAVVMGVAGAGKTTVGERLAERLDWEFLEGDRLHPPENVAKMAERASADRRRPGPVARSDRAAIDGWLARGAHGVVTCSALKREYRRRIIGQRAVFGSFSSMVRAS